MTYVDHVVEGAMLRDCDEGGLVVRSGVDGREPVIARRKTVSYINRNNPVFIGRGIHALEESKDVRVQNLGRRHRINRLDGIVGVTDDIALGIHLLWRGVVVRLGIHEVPRFQVVERHFDRERRVGLHGAEVRGKYKFGRGHVCGGRNHAHRDHVTRAGLDLLAIGERLIDRKTEIDKVIAGGQRGDLAGGCVLLAIIF